MNINRRHRIAPSHLVLAIVFILGMSTFFTGCSDNPTEIEDQQIALDSDKLSSNQLPIPFGGIPGSERIIKGGIPSPNGRGFITSECEGGETYEVTPLSDKAKRDAKATGIPDRKYKKDPQDDGSKGYDCDDFAEDMEEAMEEKGYDVVVVVEFVVRNGRLTKGHCYNAVRNDDGSLSPLEPQNPDVDPKMDGDGDGDCESNPEDSPYCTTPKEGSKSVTVYDSFADAEGHVKMD